VKILLFFILFYNYIYANSIEILESKYFLDSQHSYTINQAYKNKDSFLPFAYEKQNFGLREDSLWLYIKVKNTSLHQTKNMIEFLFPLHDYIEVIEYSNGQIIDKYTTGDLTKHSTRRINTNNFIIPYTIDANQTKEFLFKIDSKSTLNAGIKFLTQDEFYSESNAKELILGSYYGAVLIMLLYNIILYLMIKEKVYLYYVLFHFSYLLAQLSLNGFAFTYLWPDFPQINAYFFPLAMIATSYLSIVFSLEFLDLKRSNPKLYNYYKFLLLLHFLPLISIFFLSYASVLKMMLVLSPIAIISLFMSSIYILIKYKTVAARFFVIAWSSILIGALLTELQNIGFLSMSFAASYGAQIGAFIELTLLSIALAHKYNAVHNKLSQTESELRVLNIGLQEKVDEQTKNLQLLIKELHHRVKNNFQFILTFLWAQKQSIKDEVFLQALEQTTQRIYAISSLHELINISDTVSINIKAYIDKIISSLILQDETIVYDLDNITDLTLEYNEAVTIGLILNELITNSQKYAFTNTPQPIIKISVLSSEDSYEFEYCDNGKGCEINKIKNSTGLGYELIHGLIQKNNAKISINSDNGIKINITFPKKV